MEVKKFIKYITLILLYISIFCSIIILIINLYIIIFSYGKTYKNENNIKYSEIGLILGASVRGNMLSPILKDRVDNAIKLYHQGKFQIFLVSGDNGTIQYNEVIPIRKYLIKNGIGEDKIYIDFAGFDTYDTMYRAKNIFGVKNMIIFTQGFHLSRSIYIANRLGINAIGFKSDLHDYPKIIYYEYREIFSRIKAFFEVEIIKAKPKYLGEKIDIYLNIK